MGWESQGPCLLVSDFFYYWEEEPRALIQGSVLPNSIHRGCVLFHFYLILRRGDFMINRNQDGNGLRAALTIACESVELAARLRISLPSTSSEGLILEALMGGYLKKKKQQLLLMLILFSLKTIIGHAFRFCFRLFFWKLVKKSSAEKILHLMKPSNN